MGLDQSYIESKTSAIFDKLRNDENSGYYNGLLILLVILVLGSILFHFIKFGFSVKLSICIGLLFIMLIMYKMRMQSAYKLSSSLNNFESLKETDQQQYFTGFLNFLQSGLDIKRVRSSFIKTLYVVTFPIFLFLAAEVYNGKFDFKTGLLSLILAYFLSWFVWKSVFGGEMDQWDDIEDEINAIKRTIFS